MSILTGDTRVGALRVSFARWHAIRRWLVLVALAGLAASCTIPGPPNPGGNPPPAGLLVVVPATIDPTGATDVTEALRAFIMSVPHGTTVAFGRGARYRVEDTIVLKDRRDLTIEGNGAIVFATTPGYRERSQLRFVRGSHVTVRNLVVRGANPNAGMEDAAYVVSLEAQHGFQLDGVQDFELDQVIVTDVYGDFVYIGRDHQTFEWSDGVRIHDSTFTRNGRQGITITAARNVWIERNDISNTRRATFDFEPWTESGGAFDVHIVDNRVGDGRLFFIAAQGVGEVSDIEVRGNQLRGRIFNMEVKAPPGSRRSNWVVTGNTSPTRAMGRVMRFIRVDNVVVRGNSQAVNRPNEAAVVLWDSCGAIVEGNDFGLTSVPFAEEVPCGAP